MYAYDQTFAYAARTLLKSWTNRMPLAAANSVILSRYDKRRANVQIHIYYLYAGIEFCSVHGSVVVVAVAVLININCTHVRPNGWWHEAEPSGVSSLWLASPSAASIMEHSCWLLLSYA